MPGSSVARPPIYQERPDEIGRMQRLVEQFCMHPLTADERVTCESMLSQEPSSRVVVMPTHHINALGDMMGFR
jgi:hypothetical protein